MRKVSFIIPSTLLFTVSGSVLAAPVQFNKEIRPILSENCFHCHGPDPGSREAGLRLDTKEGFFEKTEKRGPTVVSGRPDESPLYQRLITKDPEEIMPPPKAHKVLKPEQIAVIKRWISEGAPWEPHWSFIKPERPPIPAVGSAGWVKNPIDAFVLQKLEAKGLAPAPEADRPTLARRAAYDLTGLPPSPAEVDAFVADASPDAYEKYLDQQMAKPQWGEHRGRYWLDAARYADTHGLHFDNYREMWPYRDWVISAFNRNQPFDQFTLEQLAGDLLPNPTPEQLVATGFHRCNITTNEGGTIEEENLVGYARDRVETTSWVWLGLTANCAVCHDHKFDPISMKDFYSLSAYFRNTTQGAMDGNVKDTAPVLMVPQMADMPRWEALGREIDEVKKLVEERKKAAEPGFQRWLEGLSPEGFLVKAEPPGRQLHLPIDEGKGEELAIITAKGTSRQKFTGLKWQKDGKTGVAAEISDNSSIAVAEVGGFEKNQPFSAGAWVNTASKKFGGILARMDTPQNGYRGWDLFLNGGEEVAVHLVQEWPKHAIKVAAPKSIKRKSWQHICLTYDGSGKAEGIKIYVDGIPQGLRIENNTPLDGSIANNVPFRVGRREGGEGLDRTQIQDVRIYDRSLSHAEINRIMGASELAKIIATTADKRTPAQIQKVFDFYLVAEDASSQENVGRLAKLEAERSSIQGRGAVTHIQQEKMGSEPMAAVLFRGNYDQPRDKTDARPFATLHPAPVDAPKNRLGLAKWLLSPENPLTARVTINRFWQEIFGVGIVKTSEDFGIVGDAPTHPELLDWLAVEFQQGRWDVKRFFKLVMTSNTYRQSSLTTQDKLEKDPANRLLSRGPRFRMDAEMVRDTALATSGLLVKKLGGPSVKPYQPQGVWEAVAMPESNTRSYKQDTGESLYRRSLYTFWKRAAPPASMEIFNATARETSCLRRERTNTPLQALVTMNDIQFIEAARTLAQSALKHAQEDDKRIDFLARHAISRSFTPEELTILRESIKEQQAYFAAKPDEATKLISYGESKPDPTANPAVLAAWTMLTNQILNLDEVLNK